jgi:hypothetical protein
LEETEAGIDVKAFEAVYRNEHVPLAVAKLEGKTKIVATKVLGSPQGMPGFYRIAEVHFPSMRFGEFPNGRKWAYSGAGRIIYVRSASAKA